LEIKTTRIRIGLLSGCMSRLFLPQVAPSATALLTACGFEVVLLDGFGCCGAPFREAGLRKKFRRQARNTVKAYLAAGELEAVVCDSGACAVTVRSYGRVLAKDADYADAARVFADKTQDLNGFLAKRTTLVTMSLANPGLGSLSHHDHCQTRHGLGTITEPRRLLASLPTPFRELPRGDQCCGAGGDYVLHHPKRSRAILSDKTAAILESGADTVVGDNPGCLLNMEAGLRIAKTSVRVRHMAEVLWTAVRNRRKDQHTI